MISLCRFWSEMLSYESKRYLVRLMILKSMNPVSSLILVMRTYSSRDAWTWLIMVRLV